MKDQYTCLEHKDLGTVEAQIDAWAGWFDCRRPALAYEDGSVLLTDELAAWFKNSGATIDWIICGDPATMARAHMRDRLLPNLLGQIPEDEQISPVTADGAWTRAAPTPPSSRVVLPRSFRSARPGWRGRKTVRRQGLET